MGGKTAAGPDNRLVSAEVLRRMANVLVPFYEKIARELPYALRWSQVVRKADLAAMQTLLVQASPKAKKAFLASNGIGYFVTLPFPKPIVGYVNGTTIPPGSTQFFFETSVHRRIVRAVLPLYRDLASEPAFAARVARAIRGNRGAELHRLLRCRVHSAYLRVIRLEESGFALEFKYPDSRFVYRNLMFREENP